MKTLTNFRDIGGYKTQNGYVVKGKFFRSGEPVGLSKEDIENLRSKYKVKHIYDFRTKSETEKRPVDSIKEIEYHHIDIMQDETETTSFSHLLKITGSVDEAMKRLYANIINSPVSQALYKEFLEAIYENNQEAILFHCFAGKDRTGIGAAFILKILGVSKEDIFSDFLLTNIMRKEANALVLKEMAKTGASKIELQRRNDMLSVKKEYLEEAFNVINKNYNSFENYLFEGLGLSKNFILNMQERFIA